MLFAKERTPEINIQESLEISRNIPGIDIMEQFVYQKDDSIEKVPSLPQASAVGAEDISVPDQIEPTTE